MKSRNRTLLAAACLALLAASCRTTEKLPTQQPKGEETRIELQAPRTLTVLNFNAVVEGISVNGQLRMAEDSVIWVTVNKIIELGRAMATTDSVWVTVPVADRHFAGTYEQAARIAKQEMDFNMLQDIVNAPDAERRIEALAARMGFNARVRITSRKQVDRITFPFVKQ